MTRFHQGGLFEIDRFREMWHVDLEKATRDNRDWRRVLFTGEYLQVVLMSVPPGQELGWEMHHDTDQFFRVDGSSKTRGVVRTVQGRHSPTSLKIDQVEMRDGVATAVRAGTWHNVINTSRTTPLTFYTIYAPPHHPANTRQKKKPMHSVH